MAGVLAVSYTGGDTRDDVGAQPPPPVQRPEPKPPTLPPDDPTPTEGTVAPPTGSEPPTGDSSAPTEPASATTDPAASESPLEPSVEPPPSEPGPAPADAPVGAELDAPRASDEPAPIAEPLESPGRKKAKALLRPTDNRRFFSMGVGGASATGYSAYYGGGMDFQWEMAIGSHGRRRPNFGGAFVVQQRKGLVNELSFVGRFQWDKPFSEAFALYSSLNVDLGVNVPIGYGGYLAFPSLPPSAMIGLGWGIKGVLAERFLMWLRPVNPNLVAPAYGSFPPVTFRWDVMAGVGVVW